MEIQQIRNATNKIKFGGVTFLLDPWLADKGSMGSFDDISQENYQVPDPVKMVLPMPFTACPCPEKKSGKEWMLISSPISIQITLMWRQMVR